MDIKSLLDTATAVDDSSDQSRVDALRAHLAEHGADADLEALQAEVVAEFDKRHQDGKFEPGEEANLYALADIADALRAEASDREQAAAENEAKFADLAARVNGPAPEPGEGDSSDQDDTDTDSEGGGDTSESDTSEPDSTAESTGTNDQEERQPVAASRRTRPTMSARALNAHRPKQTVGTSTPLRRMVLTAAADVPQVPSGSQLDMSTLSQATIRRFQSMPIGAPNTHVKHGLALVKTEADDSVTLSGDRTDMAKIDQVADEKRLPGGSLLAAHNQTLTAAAQQGTFSYGGTWCAPSETDYTLCPSLATSAGIADFPEITVNHGGIRYPVYRQYPDFDFTFQEFDENADFAATPKTCVTGVCPEWEEVRLKAYPLCIKGDILRERGYPEITQRFLDDVMLKHQHWMNKLRLDYIDANSTALAAFDASTEMGSASYTIADRIGLLVEWLRETYRMDAGATLEGIAPMWLKGLLKADIAKRNNRTGTTVSDAEVNAVFTERGARVQWVYDWQGMNPGGAQATVPVTAWPTSANMLLYPAGSWVAGNQDIIDLSAVYDSTDLTQNIYTAVFTEQAALMLNRCNPSYKVQLTNLCANGVVGGFRDICAPEAAPTV